MSAKGAQQTAAASGLTMVNLSVDQMAGQWTKAVETGAAMGRGHADALERTIGNREAWIGKQAEQIQALTTRVIELTDQLGKLAQTSLDLAVVEANQKIGLARAKDEADFRAGLLKLAREEVLPVVAAGLLPAAAAARAPGEVRDVLAELLADEALVGALIAKVGPEKFTVFADWAGRV